MLTIAAPQTYQVTPADTVIRVTTTAPVLIVFAGSGSPGQTVQIVDATAGANGNITVTVQVAPSAVTFTMTHAERVTIGWDSLAQMWVI